MKLIALSVAALLLTGCGVTWPAKPSATKKDATPVEAAANVTDAAAVKADAAVVEVAKKGEQRDSKVLANVNAAREANQSNPEGHPKETVDTELEVAQSRMADVVPDPAETLIAAQRRASFAAGRASEAKASAEKSSAEAKQAVAEIATAREAAVQAIKARDEARAAEATARANFVAQLEANRKANQAAIDKARDEERKEMTRLITYGLLAIAGIAILVGAFLVYSKIQTGDIPKAILVGAVFGGAAAVAAACAWTINQPWFKYVIWGSAILGVAAVIFYLQSEMHEARQKKQRSVEADEAEDTLARIMTALDKLPEGEGLFTALSGTMNDDNKALLHELRAEAKRRSAKKTG